MSDTPETDAEHQQFAMGGFTLDFCRKLERERDEAREDAKLITMDESEYAAKCIEVYATITPEGIEDLWPPEIQTIIHEMHEIGGRLKGNNSQQNQ